MKKVFTTCGVVCLVASFCHAGPSSLITIPIADVLGQGEARIKFNTVGYEGNKHKTNAWQEAIQFGLGSHVEAGWHNNFLGSTIFNFKVGVYQSPKKGHPFAVSIGMNNLDASNGVFDKYLVARQDTNFGRFHLGWYYNDNDRMIFGFDKKLNKLTTLQLDGMTGKSSTTWIGLARKLGKLPITLAASAGIPSLHDVGIQHKIAATYSVRF